ncbi:MAG: hypothetical protein GMKNLPBB_01960 [Myxococcota bacterium]|nr:hypothetical protein [Myxococcota bacterium]
MLDRSLIGLKSLPGVNEIEKGAIRKFAEALGEHNPIYHDEEIARALGFKSLVAPPTFIMTLKPGSNVRESLNLDYRRVLHGEFGVRYIRPITAGEKITVVGEIKSIHEKQGASGRNEFIEITETGTGEDGSEVFTKLTVVVYRPEPEERK